MNNLVQTYEECLVDYVKSYSEQCWENDVLCEGLW